MITVKQIKDILTGVDETKEVESMWINVYANVYQVNIHFVGDSSASIYMVPIPVEPVIEEPIV